MYVNFINPFYVTSDVQILAQQIKNTVQEAVDDMNDENINQLSILIDTLTLMLEVPTYSQELIQNSNILSLLELANIKLTKDNNLEQKILIFQNQLSQQNHLQNYWIKQQQTEIQPIEHNILDLIVADNKKLFQILIRMFRIMLLHFESNKQQAPNIFYFYKHTDSYNQQLWEQAIMKLIEYMVDENTEQEYKYRIIDIFIFLNREDQLMNKMLVQANIIPELVKLSPIYTKRCLLLIRDLIDKQENPQTNLDVEVTGQTLFNIIKIDKHNTQINSLVSQILQKINYKPQKQERQQVISQENAQEYVDNICFQVLSNKQDYDEQEIIQMLEIIVKNQDLQEDVILSIFFIFETYMKQIVQKIKNQICVQAYKLLIKTQHEKVILQGLQLCYILHSDYKIQVQEQKLKIIVENNINNNQIMRLVDKILQLKRRVKKRLEDETIMIQEEDISKLTDRQLRHTIVMKQIQEQVINPQQPQEPPNRFSMGTSMVLEEEDEVELLLKESLRRANYITCIESLHYILQLQQDYNEECHGYIDLIIQIYLLYPTSSQVINYAKDIFSRIFIQSLIENTIQEVNQDILDIKILRRFAAVSLLIQDQDIFINVISQLVINKMDQDQLYISLVMIKNQNINQQIINSFLLDYFNTHQPPLKLKALQYCLNINFDPKLALQQIDESITQISEELSQNQFYNTFIVLQLITHYKKDKLFLIQNQLPQKFLTVQEFIILYYTTHIIIDHILLESLQIFEELSNDNLLLEQLNYKVYLGQLQQIIQFGKDNMISTQLLKIILSTYNQQFQKKQICDYYDNQFIDDNSLAYVTLNRDQDQETILAAVQIFEKLVHSNNKRRFNYLKQLLEDLLIDDLLIDIKQDILNLLDKFKVKEIKQDQARPSQISQALVIQQIEQDQSIEREQQQNYPPQNQEKEQSIEKEQQQANPPQNQETQKIQQENQYQPEQVQEVKAQEILVEIDLIDNSINNQVQEQIQQNVEIIQEQQPVVVIEQNQFIVIEKEEIQLQVEPPQQQNDRQDQGIPIQENNQIIEDIIEELVIVKEVEQNLKNEEVSTFQEDQIQNVQIKQDQQVDKFQIQQPQENSDSIQSIEQIAILLNGITKQNQSNILGLILKDINKFIYDDETAVKAHQLKITQNLINMEGSEIQLRLLDKIFKFTQSSLSCENEFDLSKLQYLASNYLLRIAKNTSHLKQQQGIMIGQQKIKVLVDNYQQLDDFKLYFKCLDSYCINIQAAQLYFDLQIHQQVIQFHNKYSEECYQLVGSMCILKQAQQAYQELIPQILQKLQLTNKILLANSFYALSGLVYCNQTNIFNKDLGKFINDAINLDDGPIIEAICSFISNLTYKNDLIKKQLRDQGFLELFYQKLFKAPTTLALKQLLRVLGNLSFIYDNAVILIKMDFIKFVDKLAKQKELTNDLLNIYSNFGAHQLLETPQVLIVLKIIKRNLNTPQIIVNALETILALIKNHSIYIVQHKMTEYLIKLLTQYDQNVQIKYLCYRVISNLSVEQQNQSTLQQLLPLLKNTNDVAAYYQKIISRFQGTQRSSMVMPQRRVSNILTQQGYEFVQFRTDGSHKQAILKILPSLEIFAAQKSDGAVSDKYRIKTITKYVFNINPLIDYPIYVKQSTFRKEYFFVIEGLFGKEKNIIAGMTKTLEAKQSLYEEIVSIYQQYK